eukprot:364373-Chlamydomonas_euryale.AAC.1
MDAGATPPVADIHYCERSRALALVLADGSAALCSGIGDAGPLDGLSLSHWLVAPPERHATCARIGWVPQLVAVGCSDGDVALFRLHRLHSAASAPAGPLGCGGVASGQQPVRVLSLEPWGHRLEQTGGVAAVEWAPDGRALAVGHARRGITVWSPSGCRL